MYLPMIPSWCTARRFIPTRQFTIHLRGTTPQGWQFLSALAWPRARSGAVVGGGAAAGVAIITSTSTITTISTATPTSAAPRRKCKRPLAAQTGTSRRGTLSRPGDGEQVWRDDTG